MVDSFDEAGVELIAISVNAEALAKTSATEWGLEKLTVGYGLELEDAKRWGLFASAALKDNEPSTLIEPGIFIIRPDGKLYASIVQTMPFSRPPAEALLKTLQWVAENDYPARGEATLA